MNKRKQRIKKFIQFRSGMTMVEVVVSAAIIALAALILSSAFGSALKVLRRGADYQSAGNSAFTAIEGDNATNSEPGQKIHFKAGGKSYEVDGTIYSQEEPLNDVDVDGVTFFSFEPDEPEEP